MPNTSKTVDLRRGFSLPLDGNGQCKPHSDWLERAARLPGKSMHLAVVLQRLATSTHTRRVALGNATCLRFGLTRNAKYRALRSLEEAGLVAVTRKLGRSPIVTLIDAVGGL